MHTNVTAVGGNINSFMLQYIFNNTEIIDYKPLGKITYELYDERGNLIEKGALGGFNSTVAAINKPVLEGYNDNSCEDAFRNPGAEKRRNENR